jgi:hypothetical protein
MKKCPYCGKEYPDEVPKCAVDKTPLGSDAPTPILLSEGTNDVRTRFRKVRTMAIYGAILFGALTILLPFVVGFPAFTILAEPAGALLDFAGFDPKNSFVHSPVFLTMAILIVNSLIGAIAFGLVAAFRQFRGFRF